MSKFSLSHEQLIQLCKRAGKNPREFFDGVLVDEAKETLGQMKLEQETQEVIDEKKHNALGQFKNNLIAIVTEAIGVMHLTKYGERFIFGELVPQQFQELVNEFVTKVESLYFPEENKRKTGESGPRRKWYVNGAHVSWRNDGTNKFNPLYQICEMIPNLQKTPVYHVTITQLKSHFIKHLDTGYSKTDLESMTEEGFLKLLSDLTGKTIEVR